VINSALSPSLRPNPCTSPPLPVNLAFQRPVDVTGQLGGQPGSNAVDGLADTTWNSGGAAPQSITVDLGSGKTISEVRLLVAQSPAGATTHVIEVRKANGAYKTVHTFAGSTTEFQWLRWFPSKPLKGVRYVRVVTTSSVSDVAWREVQVISG